ncbi:MAG: dihydroorotate dehydrogenase electron transfer subunit [Bacteroidales bacterium]|nr:dihydroorotate dehydrogenase electron transfer subunit [Bacteroidales bacterium]
MDTRTKRADVAFTVVENRRLHPRFVRLVLQAEAVLQAAEAGQFVQVRVPSSLHSWLRVPISLHEIDAAHGRIALLVQEVGEGSRWLAARAAGDRLDVLYPLGTGFRRPASPAASLLLVGGGCGLAPLYGLLKQLKRNETPHTGRIAFLTGARTAADLLMQDEIAALGAETCACTEDGSFGEKGLVTVHPVLQACAFDQVYTCGPTPMMKAVAAAAQAKRVPCQVSLENKMACGIGACLCCVTPDKDNHHRCVCTEGPVFDADTLGW